MFIILFPLGSTKKKNARSSLKSKSITLTYADFAKTNTEEGCLVEKTCLSVIDIIAFLYIVYIYMNTKDKKRGGRKGDYQRFRVQREKDNYQVIEL